MQFGIMKLTGYQPGSFNRRSLTNAVIFPYVRLHPIAVKENLPWAIGPWSTSFSVPWYSRPVAQNEEQGLARPSQ